MHEDRQLKPHVCSQEMAPFATVSVAMTADTGVAVNSAPW
jgi:hypothetical protein